MPDWRNSMLPSGQKCLSKHTLQQHTAAPHFAARSDVDCSENLLWSSIVKAKQDSNQVMAMPCTTFVQNEDGQLLRHLTVPIDTGMNDHFSFWTRPHSARCYGRDFKTKEQRLLACVK